MIKAIRLNIASAESQIPRAVYGIAGGLLLVASAVSFARWNKQRKQKGAAR